MGTWNILKRVANSVAATVTDRGRAPEYAAGRAGMSRSGHVKLASCLGVLAIAAPAAPAVADVLQIAPGEAAWVSGGPAAAANFAAEPASTAGEAHDAVPVAAITEQSQAPIPPMWRARITKLAAQYDISPHLLEAVVWQESRWRVTALSPVGARGLTQLMPGTARQMGVNPDDPDANLEGGTRYLRIQLDAFDGDVERALAAYNAGPARVARAGGIPRIRETQAYVASIMSRLGNPVRR